MADAEFNDDFNVESSQDLCERDCEMGEIQAVEGCEIGEDIAEGQEGREQAMKSVPKGPTDAERDLHNSCHIPYRSWCDACVRARGIADQHRAGDLDKRYEAPQLGADYWFVGKQGEDPVEDAERAPVLVCLLYTSPSPRDS